MAFVHITYHQTVVATTASNTVLIGPKDISRWDSLSLLYQNSSTATAFVDLIVQAAYDPTASASDTADNWVQIPTATLAQPSALGATGSVLTGPIDNTYKWIRVLGRTAASATASLLTVTVGGHTRQ